MSNAIRTFRFLVRLTGVLLIILGVILWTGHALGLVPVHMLLGLLLAVSLWALALLVARRGVSGGFVALVVVWGVIMVVFGIVQANLLPGPAHWVIQVLHLLIGIAAIGFGEQLVRRMQPVGGAATSA